MVKANAVDKTTVVNILSGAFEDNQSVNFIVRSGKKRAHHIQALMDYSYEVCQLFGEVWLSDDKKACALLLYPDQKRFTFRSILLDIRLVVLTIGLPGISKTLKREAQIQKIQPKEKMAYLWFIGVHPKYQHIGIGSILLKEIISFSNQKEIPIYLETSTLKNLPWYEAFGFQRYNQLKLGYTLFFLKRVPDK
jgi:ribosomal protein S18 acetylase RimI-like enzyme